MFWCIKITKTKMEKNNKNYIDIFKNEQKQNDLNNSLNVRSKNRSISVILATGG